MFSLTVEFAMTKTNFVHIQQFLMEHNVRLQSSVLQICWHCLTLRVLGLC